MIRIDDVYINLNKIEYIRLKPKNSIKIVYGLFRSLSFKCKSVKHRKEFLELLDSKINKEEQS